MSDESASTYGSMGQVALDAIISQLAVPLVEAAAITVRDQIVEQINQSKPAGRRYRIPGTRYRDGKREASRKRGTYVASAPGQPPAEREAIYRQRWTNTPAVRDGDQVVAHVVNDATVGKEQVPLGLILEKGHRIPPDSEVPAGADGKKSKKRGRMAPRPHIAPGIEKAEPKVRDLIREAGQ